MLALQWSVVLVASLVAAATDISSRRIPNMLTLPLLGLGCLWAGSVGGVAGLADSAAACVLLATPFLVLFAFAGGGGGDAKMMGMLGAWLGVANGTVVLASVCLSGMVLGLLFALYKRRFASVWAGVAVEVHSVACAVASRRMPKSAGTGGDDALLMPYGVAIATGVFLATAFLWL
jgi:prepilin peptidase CpaA